MPVNLYGNIGTTYTGIVTGAELERVSQEIFGGAQVKAPEKTQATQQQVQTQHATPQQVDLYARSTDLNLTQQVSQIKTDFNVQLSPQALQNIEALRAIAATQQSNVQRISDGRFQPMVDNSTKSDIETVFAVPHPTTIVKSFSLDKDKKGSNPFAYAHMPTENNNQEENAEGSVTGAALSIVA